MAWYVGIRNTSANSKKERIEANVVNTLKLQKWVLGLGRRGEFIFTVLSTLMFISKFWLKLFKWLFSDHWDMHDLFLPPVFLQ